MTTITEGIIQTFDLPAISETNTTLHTWCRQLEINFKRYGKYGPLSAKAKAALESIRSLTPAQLAGRVHDGL